MLRERWHNVALTLVNYARVKDSYSNSRDVRERSFQLKKESFVLIVEFGRKIFSFENENKKIFQIFRNEIYILSKYSLQKNGKFSKPNFGRVENTLCPDC